jgi:hypothetical protein
MKKLVLIILVLSAGVACAQVKLGLRVASQVSMNRVTDKNATDGIDYTNNGSAVRFSGGPVADFYIRDNYAFSSGFWYTVKRVSYKVNNIGTDAYANLQTVQIPFSLKLFTDELENKMKVYFLIGGTADFKISEKHKDNPTPPSDDVYAPIDAGILLGSGLEIPFGTNTIFYSGIIYNRGLFNAAKNPLDDQAKIKNTLFGLEAGIKF